MTDSTAHRTIPAAYLTRVYQDEDGGRFLYVDNDGDKGGPTKGGVTEATLSGYRGHSCTALDVKNLSKAEADAIYSKLFWTDPGFDTLPLDDNTLNCIFDMGMGSGPVNAVKILQDIVGLTQDGRIGPATRSACISFTTQHPYPALNNAYVKERVKFYDAIVARDPSQQKWLHGWCNRAQSFMVSGPTKTKLIADKLRTTGNHLGTATVAVAGAAASLAPQVQNAHDSLSGMVDGHPILSHAVFALGVTAVSFRGVAAILPLFSKSHKSDLASAAPSADLSPGTPDTATVS